MIRRIFGKIGIILRSVRFRILALTRGSRISLGATVYIHRGGRIQIGSGVRVTEGCVLTVLPGAVLVLKEGCIFGNGTFLYCASRIEVGRWTRVAHYCSIMDHDYDYRSGGPCFDKPKVSAPIVVGDNVWIGAYVLILKGVTIGDRSVIGAQTMVKKSVPERMLVYCHSNSQLTLKNLQ